MATKKNRGYQDGIADGVKDHHFSELWGGLSKADRESLYLIMARIAERSYRRGLQQGVALERRGEMKMTNAELHDWRYNIGLDTAPRAETTWEKAQEFYVGKTMKSYVHKSWWRLEIESNEALRRVGIDCPFSEF